MLINWGRCRLTLPRFSLIITLIILWLNFPFLADAGDDNTVVNSQEQLEKIYLEIQDFINRSVGGIKIEPPPLVKLADKDEVQFKFVQNTGRAMDVIGFYQPSYPEQIYILAGYSKIKTAAVLCHEYTHAWQSRNCPIQEVALQEGFATWVEYKYLLSRQQFQLAQQLRRLSDQGYGAGLKNILELEAKLGIPKLIEWVKTKENF